MKWITRIALQNYRAFGEDFPAIEIPPGYHMLFYGENGSGKSSLFSALRDFLNTASINAGDPLLPFELHRFPNIPKEGAVVIDIHDSNQGLADRYLFTNDIATSSNRHGDIISGNRVKAFLDYKRLMPIHAFNIERNTIPNMFDIVIEQLIGEHEIPDPAVANAITNVLVKDAISALTNALCNYNSRSKVYKDGIVHLARFNVSLNSLVTSIFNKAEDYLQKNFKASIDFKPNLIPIDIVRRNFQKKQLQRTLQFGIKYDGEIITDYHYFLNEARLSAIALSIFLAASKLAPIPVGTLKVLYLDDVFIGMDTGNRLPLLEILEHDFIRPKNPDGSNAEPWQVIISTYDRHWYDVVQRHLDGQSINCAQYELYRLKEDGHDKPLLLPKETNYDRAVGYLKNPDKPDYPAAANYFRKYAEEMIHKFLPDFETREGDDSTYIPDYKLTKFVLRAIDFSQRCGWDTIMLQQLKNSLSTLLHPLSHYQSLSPIYKEELEEIAKLLPELKSQLEERKFNYRILIPAQVRLTLNFNLANTETGHYYIKMIQPIYIIRQLDGTTALSKSSCGYQETFTRDNGNDRPIRTFPRQITSSLANAYQTIFTRSLGMYPQLVQAEDYSTQFTRDDGNTSISLSAIQATFVWPV